MIVKSIFTFRKIGEEVNPVLGYDFVRSVQYKRKKLQSILRTSDEMRAINLKMDFGIKEAILFQMSFSEGLFCFLSI
jgi:hypothetical protein